MREIDKIIIHSSGSESGNADMLDRLHKQRGWDSIGYHFVITNGVLSLTSGYDRKHDGVIEEGREVEKTGAHCYGHNKDSIGVCLIGKNHFTAKQLTSSLSHLLRDLCFRYGIDKTQIFGHNSFNSGKVCPNFVVVDFLQNIRFTK